MLLFYLKTIKNKILVEEHIEPETNETGLVEF